ncbi:MAG: Abi-alpha family protein, partial [Oscillospiraceae bacterium]
AICDSPQNVCQYLENIERLKLINIPDDRHLMEDAFYQPLENSPVLQAMKTGSLGDGEEYEYARKVLYVTNYGLAFISCCIDG